MDEYQSLISKLENKIIGFHEYYEEIVLFYKNFFNSSEELEEFLFRVYEYPVDVDTDLVIPRIMINSVQRLISLSDDMDIIRPQKSALKTFFLVVCIESLYVNAKLEKQFRKYEMIIDFFENYINEDDKEFIINRIVRSFADDKFVPGTPFDPRITMEVFARIINEVRNTFVHQGDYYSFNFSQPNSDFDLMQSLTVEEEKSRGKNKRIYEIRLDFNSLRDICIKGFINFIVKFMKSN